MGVSGELDASRIGAHAALHGFVEGGRFGLEGDMADAESFAEERPEIFQDMLTIREIIHQNMAAHGFLA